MKKLLTLIILLASIIGIIYSSYNLIVWKKDTSTNTKIQKELEEKVKVKGNNYEINFEDIKKINSNVVAYLSVPNTNIHYFVVKSNNNEFYLNHNFYNDKNVSGWIFMDYHNNMKDDKNIVIYGHNMKNGSMFGTLRRVLSKDWYSNEDNRVIELVTENGLVKYDVFSTYQVEVEDYYIKTEFANDEFRNFVKTILKRSNYNYHVNVSEDDSILTLSTCAQNGKKRVVLHAKKSV